MRSTERVTLTIDREVMAKVREMARKEGKSMSRVVSEALQDYFTVQKRKQIYAELKRAIKKAKGSFDAEAALAELEKMRHEWR